MSEMVLQSGQPVVLSFAGQGAQHTRMAAGLYGHDEVFTSWMDQAFALYRSAEQLRDWWLNPVPQPEFDEAAIAQPLLYAVNHALGRMVLSWGIRPAALLGHSVGEIAAATLAGVLTFEAGVQLIEERITRFSLSPRGGMVAVAASVNRVEELLVHGDVHLAAVNGPRQLLLSGRERSLRAAIEWMQRRHITCQDLMCGTAFHCPVMASSVRATLPAFRRVLFSRPAIPMYSAYTRDVLDDLLAVDPDFWAWQAARTVYFGPTLNRLLHRSTCLLVEAGPGTSLTMLARRHPMIRNGSSRALSLLPGRSSGDEADRRSVDDARDALGLRLTVAAGV